MGQPRSSIEIRRKYIYVLSMLLWQKKINSLNTSPMRMRDEFLWHKASYALLTILQVFLGQYCQFILSIMFIFLVWSALETCFWNRIYYVAVFIFFRMCLSTFVIQMTAWIVDAFSCSADQTSQNWLTSFPWMPILTNQVIWKIRILYIDILISK